MTREQEELNFHAELLRQMLQEKRKEVEDLEKRWKEANRKARGDWSADSYRMNVVDDDGNWMP